MRPVVYGVLAAAAVAGWLWWRSNVREQELTDELDRALPPRLAQWARELASAAVATKPADLELEEWARILAAVIDRESGGGIYLTPRGAAGVGDGGHGRGLGQIDDRPYSGIDPDTAHEEVADLWRREKARAEKRLAFIASGRWKLPGANIRFAAEHLRSYFDDPARESIAAGVAAYNAGPRALLAGNPDSVTTHRDYASDVLSRAARIEAAS